MVANVNNKLLKWSTHKRVGKHKADNNRAIVHSAYYAIFSES